MRQRSQGRYSLDDFCRRFFGGASDGPRVLPYAFEDVVATLTELVPYDWRAFFTERLTSTSTAAPLGGITASGWRLTYRSPDGYRGMAESDPDNTTRLLSLGMSLASDGEIQEMTPGGPADQAGLAPGMQVASVNGRKYAPEEIRQAIQDARSGSGSVELIVQSRGVYRTVRLNSQDGERFPELERDGSHPDLLSEILRPLAR